MDHDQLNRAEDGLRATLTDRAGQAPPPGDVFGELGRRRKQRRTVTAAAIAAALALAGAVTVPAVLLHPSTTEAAGPGPAGFLTSTPSAPTTQTPSAPATRLGHLSWGADWLPPGVHELGRKAGSVNTIRTWGDEPGTGWLVQLTENAGTLADPGSAQKVTVHGNPGYLVDSYLGAGSHSLLWREHGRHFGLDVRAPAGTADRSAAAGQAAVRIAESLRPQSVALDTPLTAAVPAGYKSYEVDVEGSGPGRWAGDIAFGIGTGLDQQSVHVAVGRGGAQPDDVLAAYDCSPGTGAPQRFTVGGRTLLWWPENSGNTGSLLTTDGSGGQPVSVCATDRSLTRDQLAQVLLSTRVTVGSYGWIGN